jgi:hypothetical protein
VRDFFSALDKRLRGDDLQPGIGDYAGPSSAIAYMKEEIQDLVWLPGMDDFIFQQLMLRTRTAWRHYDQSMLRLKQRVDRHLKRKQAINLLTVFAMLGIFWFLDVDFKHYAYDWFMSFRIWLEIFLYNGKIMNAHLISFLGPLGLMFIFYRIVRNGIQSPFFASFVDGIESILCALAVPSAELDVVFRELTKALRLALGGIHGDLIKWLARIGVKEKDDGILQLLLLHEALAKIPGSMPIFCPQNDSAEFRLHARFEEWLQEHATIDTNLLRSRLLEAPELGEKLLRRIMQQKGPCQLAQMPPETMFELAVFLGVHELEDNNQSMWQKVGLPLSLFYGYQLFDEK